MSTTSSAITAAGFVGSYFNGPLRDEVTSVTAAGDIGVTNGIVVISSSGAGRALTVAAPTAGDHLIIIDGDGAGTQSHTLIPESGVYFNTSTGLSKRKATFNAPGEAIHLVAISATVYQVFTNTGAVAFDVS